MSALRIHLFGKFAIYHDEQQVDGLITSKLLELLAYILLHRNRPLTREMLIALLWPENSISQSKKHLRQALWQLQAALDALAGTEIGRVLLVEADWIRLNPHIDLWIDVAAFEQTFDRLKDISHEKLDLEDVQALRAALDLYGGELLEGSCPDWCLSERDRLQNMYLVMLNKLMDYCELHHEYETALLYGARILSRDPAHERTHMRLMRLHYLAGDRTAALRQYHRCVTALERELGVGPSKETVSLYKQIQAGQNLSLVQHPADVTFMPETTDIPLREALGRLKQLQEVLVDVHQQVQQDIQVIEAYLHEDAQVGNA